jgi:phenylalanyl-tRNA synthetase beta chain
MKVSCRWLQEWVSLNISPQELADKLTMSGLEVEEMQSIEQDGVGDTILDIGVTANRGDCLGMLGIAREVSQLTGAAMQLPHIELNEVAPGIEECVKVRLEDAEWCPRYTARLVRNVEIGPSPKWLSNRLAALGIRSINNVVDVTNYVLMEWGQPLHAFEFDKLSGQGIVVRRAGEGEKLITLDGVERTLDKDMLVIADHERAVALAGVMGGANTEVTPDSGNVLLECAYFNPSTVRRTSRRLGLGTDSSFRFERGVDIAALPQAINRAAQLIQQLAGGEIIRGMIDEYPHPIIRPVIDLRFERVNRVLGTSLSAAEIVQLVKRTGLITLNRRDGGLRLMVPSYRSDITREIDVIEEVARIYGYQNIPLTTPRSCVANNPVNKLPQLEGKARDILVNCGFWEVVNFSFTNENICYKLNPDHEAVRLRNPLSREQQVLRTSLMPGLLENLSTNYKRQQESVCIFELGAVYEASVKHELPAEKRLIAGAMMGERQPLFWGASPVEVDFYDIKGVVEALLAGYGIEKVSFVPLQLPYLQPAAQVQLADNAVGVLGKLDEEIGVELDIGRAVYLFELDFMRLLEHRPAQKTFKPLCRYPAIIRDMALVLPEGVSAQQVEDVVWSSRNPWLRWIRLFDVYRGVPLDEGYKSLAFSFCYQADDRTLTEEEVNSCWTRLVEELEQKLGASLRK